MKPEVEQAVEELRCAFSDADVEALATDEGGAIVTINPIDLGPGYIPQQTWVRFAISFQYPYADIYPLFVRPDLVRADGQSHGERHYQSPVRGQISSTAVQEQQPSELRDRHRSPQGHEGYSMASRPVSVPVSLRLPYALATELHGPPLSG